MAQHYGKAWNRLRLAFINYQNLQRGEPVFSTAMELNASFAGGNTSEELENQFNAMQEWEEGLK